MAPTSSGSAWSERAVKPTRSQNNTVTTLRSSSAGRGAAASGAPHAPQNRNPWGLSCPHLEQLAIPAVYGELLRSAGRLDHPQDRHCPPATASPPVAPHRSCSPWHPISVGCALIIPMIIQTILLDPSRAVWSDSTANVSRLDPSAGQSICRVTLSLVLLASLIILCGEPALAEARPTSLCRSPPDRFIARRWASFVGPRRAESWRADDWGRPGGPGALRAQ